MSLQAFQLVPVAQNISIGGKIRAQVTSLEFCDKSLFIGTADSFLVEYRVVVVRKEGQEVSFTCSQKQFKYLGLKRPVTEMKALFVLERLLVVCDSTLLVLNYTDFEQMNYGIKLKHVNAVCINENCANSSPFSVQICVSRKKQLQIYNITSERLVPVKELSLSEPGVSIAMNRNFIAVAMESQVVLVNWELNHVQDLCDSNDDSKLFVLRTGAEEFLISAPGSLGLFVKTTGISERPPILFKPHLLAVAYSSPYVISLCSDGIFIYSISDQSLKQEIPLSNGCYVGNFDGNLFVASKDSVFALTPIAWETQVQALLASKHTKEALELSRNWHQAGLSREAFKRTFDRIQCQAGFIEFAQSNFKDAKELFANGSLDVRELLALYPCLTPSIFAYIPPTNPLHQIENLDQLCLEKGQNLEIYERFTVEYLEEVKMYCTAQYIQMQSVIDTSLVVLTSRINSFTSKLLDLVTDPSVKLDPLPVVLCLEANQRFHALATYHYHHSTNGREKGLDLWKKIEIGEFVDVSYPGLSHLIQVMSQLDDFPLLLKHIDFVLQRDEEKGVAVFTNRRADDKLFDSIAPDTVIEYLQRYPIALEKYLEFLVFDLNLENENFHTTLTLLYLSSTIEISKDGSKAQIEESRERLQHMLETSSFFRINLILNKSIDAHLHKECALLYGKLGEHEKALSILVYQLHDYKGAERYCIKQTKDRCRLFHSLLGIYMHPNLKEAERQTFHSPALELLNSDATDFDVAKVLQLLPQDLQCSSLDRFLLKGLREAQHKYFQTSVLRGLKHFEHLQTKAAKISTQSRFLFVSEETRCCYCKTAFSDTDYMWFPSKHLVAHPECAHKMLS